MILIVNGNITRPPEAIQRSLLARRNLLEFAPFNQEFAGRVKYLNPVIPGIRHIDCTIFADSDPPGFMESAIRRILLIRAGETDLIHEVARRIEDRYTGILTVDNVHVAVWPDGDAMRTVQLRLLITLRVEDSSRGAGWAVQRLERIFGQAGNF